MKPTAMLHHGDCIEVMKSISDNTFDLTVTSPPYDNLRTYKDSLSWGEHVWKPILEELYRTTKDGGVVVWIVNDATVNGSETGTSFKQALYAMECGFNLHDTMIWDKPNAPPQVKSSRRYTLSHEYMFVLSKGSPTTFNPVMQPCATAGKKSSKRGDFTNDGWVQGLKERASPVVKEFKPLYSVVNCTKLQQRTQDGVKHPAAFPEELVAIHINTWSNEGDIVFDPFTGSGTTGKMAVLNGRHFVGCEKVEEYYNLSKKRIDAALDSYGNQT